MEKMMTASEQNSETAKQTFKPARPDLAPKTRDELAARVEQQLDEHAADYERLAR